MLVNGAVDEVSHGEKSATALEAEQAPTPPTDELPGSGHPKQGFRLKPNQVQATLSKKKLLHAAYDAAFIAATNEWHNLVSSGRSGGQKDGTTAKAIAQRYSASLPAGSPKLTARSLYNAYREGRCGRVCPKRGFSSAIPDNYGAEHRRFRVLETGGWG